MIHAGRPFRANKGHPERVPLRFSAASALHRAAGVKIANTALCGSLTIAKRPTFGMSCGGTISFPPSCLALLALAPTLSTQKYGIQYDGMCAGICGGFAIMPTLG